jgi:hypothetical protein
MRRLRTGEWIAATGAVGLFASLFFDWIAVSIEHPPSGGGVLNLLDQMSTDSLSGWSNLGWFMDVLLGVAIVGGLSLSYMTAKRTSPAWPVGAAVLTVGLGAVIAAALALRLLDLGGDTSLGFDKIAISVQLPAYLGLLFMALIPFGGFLSLKDERTDSPEARAYTPPPARTAPGS